MWTRHRANKLNLIHHMKPDIYLDATVSSLPAHHLVQVGFICATLLLSGGWTDPQAVYVPHENGYAICELHPPAMVKTEAV